MKKIIKGGGVNINFILPSTNNQSSTQKPLLNLTFSNGINPNNKNKTVIMELIKIMDSPNNKKLNIFKNLLSENTKLINRLFLFINEDGTNIKFQNYKNRETNQESCTLLMYACVRNKVNFVSVLLESGADPCIQNNKGNVAYDYIPENSPIKKLYIEKGIPILCP